jgi:long-chain acyl-CoA synthetase
MGSVLKVTLYSKLKDIADELPYAPAIIDRNITYSYEKLITIIHQTASSLQQYGIKAEDRVGMLCLNQLEYITLLFGCNQLGAVAVPINCMQPEKVIEYILDDAKFSLLFVSEEILPHLYTIIECANNKGIKVIIIGEKQQIQNDYIPYIDFIEHHYQPVNTVTREENTAVMLYTSGTTGLPKGVLLSNENLITNVEGFFAVTELPRGDRAILALPLFHAFGQIVLLVCLFHQVTTILIQQFSPSTILKYISTHKASILPLVPTMFDIVTTAALKKGVALNYVQYCVTGGASISRTLYEKIQKVTGGYIIEGYGLTETSPVITISHSHDCYKPGSVGKPVPGVILRIAEDGEILVSGKSVCKGYWNNKEASQESFTASGEFKTGDIGYIDEEGFVFITDRKKDLIIRAGENVSPKQIEDVIFQFDAVNDVAVFGVPDAKLGEAIYCAIETTEMIDELKLKKACKTALPAHMVPQKFVLMPQLPKNALGKILKFKLKEMFTSKVT